MPHRGVVCLFEVDLMQGLILPGGPSLEFIGSVQYRNLIQRYGFDPFVIMPPNADFFDLFSSQSIASGGTGTFFAAELGPNEFVRVSAIGLESDADSLVSITNMVFRLRVNGNNDRFYGNLSDQIGTGQRPTEVLVRIFEPGSLLEFIAENNDGANTALAFGRVQGWTIPHS